jgi:hypothetical protein
MRERHYLQLYSIAILTGVYIVCIIPAGSILWLVMRQETSIQRNSSRIEQARAISCRRQDLNTASIAYKYADSTTGGNSHNLTSLKFDHGIYFLNDDHISYPSNEGSGKALPFSSQYSYIHRVFFSKDTNILASAIPPDSATDGTWKFFSVGRHDPDTNGKGRILLRYGSTTDHRDPGPFRFIAGEEAGWSTLGLIIHSTQAGGIIFFILFFAGQLLTIFLVYVLTTSLAVRIFLMDMFSGGHRSRRYAKNAAAPSPVDSQKPALWAIRKEEKELHAYIPEDAEQILQHRTRYDSEYSIHWKQLSPREKFVLYDLARDGFANYRTGNVLYGLIHKGLLVFNETKLTFVTRSFREYVLGQFEDADVAALLKKSRQTGSWLSFKTPLTILLTAFGLFLFFTQDAMFQKLTGLLTSLVSIGAQFSTLFDRTAAGIKNDSSETPTSKD